MNSLTIDEFTEFIKNREFSEDILKETGRTKEIFQNQQMDNFLELREKFIADQ